MLPVPAHWGVYFAFAEVAPNLIMAIYGAEASATSGRVYLRYLYDGQPVQLHGESGAAPRSGRKVMLAARGAR